MCPCCAFPNLCPRIIFLFAYLSNIACSKYRVSPAGESIYAQPKYTPEQVLYQPLSLFPVQLLPYQYYQIIHGKFLLPTPFSLYNFFIPPFPFAEIGYKELGYKEPSFKEKGEYSQ